ncbi:MAG: DNA/RNA non-specific endonuclease [Oscillatoria princeps RMCB-10]|jgi:DNA/RNA endonuclease G (NUC1)|nr:DNA/RNA non-specific endonuclease [Oscillatoria princeps RMCB-10]
MRFGALPDETGTWNPIWLQEESGVVGADGMIRTSSPPWPGIIRPGEYIVAYSGESESVTLVKGQLTVNYNLPIAFYGVMDSLGKIGQLLMPDQFGSANVALTVSYDISSVKVMAVPTVGLPVITEVGVQRNQDGIASFSAALNMPAPAESDPTAPPVLQEAELKFADENNQAFENNQPVLFLTGSNVLVNSGSDLLGSRFEDLVAKFYVGDKAYEGTVLPNLSRELGDNRFEVAVKVPNTVPLGASRIVLTRRQNHLAGQNGTEPVYEEVGYDSNNIRINQGAEYIFAAQRGADRLAVIDGTDPESVVSASNSSKLLLASIPAGTPDRIDRPRASAVTSDGTRVYVVLESTGRVALVDPIVLQQVDTQPDIPDINPINLPAGAVPWSIAINSRNEYAYIADSARGNIYILDINPFSETYHQVVQTIAVNPASSGLRKMAISSDGRKLFVTAANGYIYVINIDGQDRPTDPNQNARKWHEQIGAVLTNNGADGVAATADPLKLTFTNGQQNSDAKGFGVLEVTNDDPLNFAASARYIDLSLGNVGDYFDVNEGVAVTVMPDGRYAFVAGRNRQGSVLQTDKRAGGNIGIIKDPLTNPQLVAATRPIPQALTADLVLSNDSKYLYASYPNLNGTGSTYVFDVEEIIETLENPGNFLIDGLDRGEGSPFFDAGSAKSATWGDLSRVPVDDINPEISVAADYGIVQGNWASYQFTYGVLPNSTRGPVALAGGSWGLSAAPADWLDLAEVQWKKEPVVAPELVPTPAPPEVVIPILIWTIINTFDIVEVNLTISTFPEGEGLFRGDDSFVERPLPPGLDENKLKKSWGGVDDYNPNRVLTATWRVVDVASGLGQWEVAGKIIEKLVPNNQFPFADLLNLTGGQTYYWGVEAKSLTRGTIRQFDGQFYLPLANPAIPTTPALPPGPLPAPAPETYTSVTFLTPDGTAFDKNGLDSAREIAGSIVDNIDGQGTDGTVMQYLPSSGEWQVLSGDGGLGKPLVLVADWSQDSTADKLNSGFSEAAADALFAALVGLNQSYGQTDDSQNQKDALFNSPMHFIGFGRGAVVNSEIIQRLGTFFPKDTHPGMFPDLQMTTVDPNDFEQQINGGTVNHFEPKIQVWENVTFADNYYQTATTSKPRGRDIVNLIPSELLPPDSYSNENRPDLSVHLGGFDESGNLSPSSRAGFTQDAKDGNNPHGRTVAWYGGTADLSWGKNNPLEYSIHRRSGDFSYGELFDPNFPDAKPWYTPNHTGQPVGDEEAQWEGIGTGWYYSVLGGGYYKRSLLPPVASERTPVYFDNTYDARMRGDFAVPTVFNGNFDAIHRKIEGQMQPIPGWSFNKVSGTASSSSTNNSVSTENLKEWRDIPELSNYITRLGIDPNAPDYQPNYAMMLKNNDKLIRNPMIMPDWGSLHFNLFVPKEVKKDGGQLKVTIQPTDSNLDPLTKTILLEDVNFNTDTYGNNDITKDADRKLGYASGNAATSGFETFTLEVPIESQLHSTDARKQEVTITFKVTNGSDKLVVYIDDVFIQSNHLRFGIPTPQQNNPNAANRKEARTSRADFSKNLYKDELLIERPQYALSYNGEKNTANWASWLVNKTWIYQPGDPFNADKRNFRSDQNLPEEFHKVPQSDYTPQPVVENVKYAAGHLVPVADRNRPDNQNKQSKNNLAISLLSNIVPQQKTHNEGGFWAKIEEYTRNFVNNGNLEVYVITGTEGVKKLSNGTDGEIDRSKPIKIPEYLWRVLLVVDRPGAPYKSNTYTVGFWTENREPTEEEKKWNEGDNWKNSTIIKSVNEIEQLTGYDFFSNIPLQIQDTIETNREIFWSGVIPDDFTPKAK